MRCANGLAEEGAGDRAGLLGVPGDFSTPIDRLVSTYAEIAPGETCALFGSSDHLELAANAASAADRLGLGKRAAIEISRA